MAERSMETTERVAEKAEYYKEITEILLERAERSMETKERVAETVEKGLERAETYGVEIKSPLAFGEGAFYFCSTEFIL